MSKFLPYEVRQTIVRNGQFSTCVIDEASSFKSVAKCRLRGVRVMGILRRIYTMR